MMCLESSDLAVSQREDHSLWTESLQVNGFKFCSTILPLIWQSRACVGWQDCQARRNAEQMLPHLLQPYAVHCFIHMALHHLSICMRPLWAILDDEAEQLQITHA